jgi:uncharacterized membrane protein
MARVEEKIEEREVSSDGKRQVVREKTLDHNDADAKQTGANLVWYIAGILEAILAIRFVLKLAGANPTSGFVDFIYGFSSIFVAPFRGIFSTPTTEGDIVTSVFETSTIVAMIIYALIAWAIAKVLVINQKEN